MRDDPAAGADNVTQPNKACAWLAAAFADHDETLGLLGIDPALDGLRPDRRFADLLRRAGLPGAPPPANPAPPHSTDDSAGTPDAPSRSLS